MLVDQHFQVQQLRIAIFIWHKVVLRKVNEIGMKEDCKKNNSLRLAIRCLPALAMFPSSDVVEVFFILADNIHFLNVSPYERTWKRYADATNTILQTIQWLKCQWFIVTWLNVTNPGNWLILYMFNYLVIKCSVMKSHQTMAMNLE